MSMFQSNRPDKKCKLLEIGPKIIPKRNLADLSTHYDLHLISCNPRILKVFEKLFPRKWSLVCPAKAKKIKKKKGSNWNAKVKTAVSLFSLKNCLDILLNLHITVFGSWYVASRTEGCIMLILLTAFWAVLVCFG